MTTAQVDALTTAQISTLTTEDLVALTPAQLAGFAQSADIMALTTSHIQALTTQQITALSTTQFSWLTTADVVALTTAQAHALTTAQIVGLTTDQVVALETADLAAMTMAQSVAFTTAELAVMSTAQIDALVSVSPIVLDLSGTGIHTTAASHGVQFDLTATGTTSQVGWVGAGSGLLVRDINHDGVIKDGTELFGLATVLGNGQRAGNGYAAMAALDSNHDNKLSATDAAWGELKVWVDANHDGKTDAGELKSLAEVGVLSINLDFTKGTAVNNGNVLGMVSSYTSTDGTQHEVADVWFAKAPAAPADLPKLGDLLVGSAHDLPLGGSNLPGADSQAAAHTALPAALSHAARQAADDELLRAQHLML